MSERTGMHQVLEMLRTQNATQFQAIEELRKGQQTIQHCLGIDDDGKHTRNGIIAELESIKKTNKRTIVVVSLVTALLVSFFSGQLQAFGNMVGGFLRSFFG